MKLFAAFAFVSAMMAFTASAEVTRTTQWQDIPDDTLVGTVVDLGTGGGGGGGGASTSAVNLIIHDYDMTNLTPRIAAAATNAAVIATNGTLKSITVYEDWYNSATMKSDGISGYRKQGINYRVPFSIAWTNILTSESDPTVPSWAKESKAPQTSLKPATNYTDKVAGAISNRINDVENDVAVINNYLDGSNVVFTITNYISGTYRTDAAKLRIRELRDGVYREVYNSHDEIALNVNLFRTNEFETATNTICGYVIGATNTLDGKIAGKADKAWGKYSSTGQDVNSLGFTNTVYITEPTTIFAGGLEYWRQTVGTGSIGLLTTKGAAAAYTTGDSGEFMFRDFSSTNYFGWVTRENFMLGCDADDIQLSKSGNDYAVTIRYDGSFNSCPILLYRATMENYASNSWIQLNNDQGGTMPGAPYDVTFVTIPGSNCVWATINCGTNAHGFVMAQTMVHGEVEFSTNMKADLKGGIVTADGAHIVKPLVTDDELVWRTYDYGTASQISTPSQSGVRAMSAAAAYVAQTNANKYTDTSASTTLQAAKTWVGQQGYVKTSDPYLKYVGVCTNSGARSGQILTITNSANSAVSIEAVSAAVSRQIATNAIAEADTTYAKTTAVVALNQSVQCVSVASNATLTILAPTGTGVKDWIVYANCEAETPLVLPAGQYYAADEAYTNALPAGVTALYFTTAFNGLVIGRQEELKPITVSSAE